MEKADLQNYRATVREVHQLREQLETLEASLFSPKGQRFTSTPRVPSGAGSTMEGAVGRHFELEDLYRSTLAEKEAQQLAVERAIQTLDGPERVVMRERYIRGRSWTSIVSDLARMGYSERQVYRLHGLALLKLKEV